jgi:hypothetical protein
MSLEIAGGVQAKIRAGDANANAAQDIACYPPDSTTPSLNCDFPGVTDTGTVDASITVDAYKGSGSYPISDNLDVSINNSNIVCSGSGGTVKITELPKQGTSSELDARLDFDAQMTCTTAGGDEDASLKGFVESHPCVVATTSTTGATQRCSG